MAMDFDYNQVLEHVDLNGMVAGSVDDGVLDGLEVGEDSPVGMDVDISAGSCYVGNVKYTESGITNLSITSAHASYARKDIVVYDTSAGNPVVVAGTAAAVPEPPDIPTGNIILALVGVPAAASSISTTDITDKRIIINRHLEYVELQNMVRGVKFWAVVSGLTPSAGTGMVVDIAAGSCQIDETTYTESGTTNVSITAADATYARRDIIIYDKSTSNPIVVDGVASAHPVAPNLPDDDILLAIINVPANATSIVTANVTDKRILSGILDSIAYINSGSYTGDNSDNRAIAHGLGAVPKFVIIDRTGEYRSIIQSNYINFTDELDTQHYTVTQWTSTNFYVGDNMDYQKSSNNSSSVYYWIAFR